MWVNKMYEHALKAAGGLPLLRPILANNATAKTGWHSAVRQYIDALQHDAMIPISAIRTDILEAEVVVRRF